MLGCDRRAKIRAVTRITRVACDVTAEGRSDTRAHVHTCTRGVDIRFSAATIDGGSASGHTWWFGSHFYVSDDE